MMHKHILLLNGPNLNLLGTREPSIYGTLSLAEIEAKLQKHFWDSLDIKCLQSNHEGVLIDALHEAKDWADGICINAGGYSHTSIAIHDAIKSIGKPCVEVHLSNIHNREAFRRKSMLAPATIGQISGFGWHSYVLGLEALRLHLNL